MHGKPLAVTSPECTKEIPKIRNRQHVVASSPGLDWTLSDKRDVLTLPGFIQPRAHAVLYHWFNCIDVLFSASHRAIGCKL